MSGFAPLALGLDPGFASIGVSVVCLSSPLSMLALRVIRTDKLKGRKSTEDNLERSIEISKTLFAVLDEFPGIKIVCAESMSYPPNASTAAKMSLCWGVIAALIQQKDLAWVQQSPQEIKKKVCGNRAATKEDIQAAVVALFSGQDLASLHPKVPKTKEEHLYDAAASVLAALDTPEFRLLRALTK